MSDTQTFYYSLSPMTEDEYEHAQFPYDRLMPVDQDGVAGEIFYRWMSVASPITGAGFKVKGVGMPGRRDGRIAGYLVEIHTPACTIGNNVLLANGVPKAAECALLLLQHWLLSKDCRKLGVYSLKLENASIKSVTLTYLFPCANREEAHEMRRTIAAHAEGILNKRHRSRPWSGSRKPVASVGEAEDSTTYIKHREFEISTYVKDGAAPDAFANFPSPDVEEMVRKEGECHLRVEIKLNGVWLRKNNRTSVDSWRTRPGQVDPYEIGIRLIRKRLRLDRQFRERRPKETDIRRLNPEDQAVLRWHLDGKNSREHPRILAWKGAHARNQFFFDVKERIWGELDIDISVPWSVQSQGLSRKLAELLTFRGRYEPPEHLTEHVYSPASVPAVLARLRREVSALTPRGIGSVYVPRDQLMEP